MQFHDYRTIRNQIIIAAKTQPEYAGQISKLKQMSSAEYRKLWIDMYHDRKLENQLDADTAMTAVSEDLWVDELRPYYNVWPIAVELAQSLKLSLPFKSIGIPFHALLLRFAHGHEPRGIPVTLLCWPRDQPVIHVCAYTGLEWHRISIKYSYDPEQQVEDWLKSAKERTLELGDNFVADKDAAAELLIRICVFVALLASDRDVITPIVLAKDQRKYESTNDPEIKKCWRTELPDGPEEGLTLASDFRLKKKKPRIGVIRIWLYSGLGKGECSR